MRDLHLVKNGTKRYTEDCETALALVREYFPDAMKEASLGAASFTSGGKIVAEAWMCARKPGWWLRIKRVKFRPSLASLAWRCPVGPGSTGARPTRKCLDCGGTGDKQPLSGERDCESCRQPMDEE